MEARSKMRAVVEVKMLKSKWSKGRGYSKR